MERFKFRVATPSRAHAGALLRLAVFAFFAVITLTEGAGAAGVPVLRADDSGVLTVTPAYANSGKTITVVVDDAGLGTTVLHEDEATDFTGNPYSLPPGAVAQQQIFRVQEGPIADMNGDGTVDSDDIQVSLNNVGVDWVNTQNGTFALTRWIPNATAKPFTVTYRNEKLDSATVEIRSSSDIDGFILTVQETGLSTNLFSATFTTGTATTKTNIVLPGAVPRPSIKVEDAGIVTVEYADASPPTLVSDAVIIDTTKPVLEVVQPANGITTRNVQNWASVDVTDDRSGLELSDITFHADVDRDGVFDETGEIFQSSEEISTAINLGWAAFAHIIVPEDDGKVSWYATATDRAGNTARTDAVPDVAGDTDTTGNQNHSFTIDTRPPSIVEVLLGEDYDPEKERDLANRPNRIRVNFSEPVEPESVVAGRFIFGDLTPVSAVVYEDRPDAVFLTYEDLPSISEPMLVLAGAVKDLPGVDSERVIMPVTDHLGPTLEVIFSTVITNRFVTVTTRSAEELASPPTIEINGVTFGAMQPTGEEREWSIELDANFLTGSAEGDGIKNVEIAGFDPKGNRAHGGVRREEPLWPEGAHTFELDREIKRPNILPAHNDIVNVHNPAITASYAEEAAEYPGDTHGSVTVVVAKLDGFDVTSLMKATTATSWTYQPESLEPGLHQFVIQARDDAGNIHGASTLNFTVDPLPTPTPPPGATEEPTATPVTVEPPGTALPTATPSPSPTAEPSPTADPPEPTPVPTASVQPTPTPDIEATAQAIRNGDGSGDDPDPSVQTQAGYTLYGCGLPLGQAGVAGGDYLVMGAGLAGLVLLSRRRRSGGDD